MRSRHRPLYLADNLWLIGHDDQSGKSHVSDHALGLGLAGSLLGELVLHHCLDVTPDRHLYPENKTNDPADPLALNVLKIIRKEQEVPARERVSLVREWLNYFAEFAEASVADRLTRTDPPVVGAFPTRKLLKRVTVYRVLNVNDALSPAIQVSSRVRQRQPLRDYDVAFAAFAIATGLDRQLMEDAADADHEFLIKLSQGLPPSLQSLIAETESAVGDAVLSHRT